MIASQDSVFKVNKVIFNYYIKRSADEASLKFNDQVKSNSYLNFNTKTTQNDNAISA